MNRLSTTRIHISAAILLATMLIQSAFAAPLDSLYLGNTTSEVAHHFQDNGSAIIPTGGLSQPARRLLPNDPPSWQGGSVAFAMSVDPDSQNYFTIKLWGGEANQNRLVLFVDGKQVGYHHIGDVDLLDFGNDSGDPPFNGRFFYTTCPLPRAATHGRNQIACEIRAIGPIWGYGVNFSQYQKQMTAPTRGIYAVYTHTDGTFDPPADETQGTAPLNPPTRSAPGPEVFEPLKQRVNHEIASELASNSPLNEMQMVFLARAYAVQWTQADQNPRVVSQVMRGMDALYEQWKADPGLVEDDRSTPNPGWFEFGPAGHAVALLSSQLTPALDKAIDGSLTRRQAWSELLQAGRDYHTHHRRLYTNQSMITDLNIAWSDRAISLIDPAHALPSGQVIHYLYQSVGLEPWLGSETDNGPQKPMGDNYFELTPKGLTKELGYVGYYGEVLDWISQIYDVTRPTPDAPGDERILDQAVKIAKARSIFRYPSLDGDGNRAMRIETIVGWRDDHFPGNVTYTERPTWDASSLYLADATLDPTLIGYAQQMFDDNQYFQSVVVQMKAANNLRVTMGLLDDPDQYALLHAMPPQTDRLPMSAGQPDFAFADEQDGVVAVKQGDHIFYASLYWRARQAVNFLARVDDIQPRFERIAVVKEKALFEPSGRMFTRPDSIDPQAPGGVHYPRSLHSALAGEKLPIAKLPPGHSTRPGQEDPAAGRCDYYELRYGDYLIGMNSTTDKTFALTPPAGIGQAVDLVSNQTLDCSQPIQIGPQSTVVLDLRSRK